MSDYDIDPGVPAAIERFKLPETLGFGPVNAPVMFEAEWRDGGWGRGRLEPYGPIELLPGARALQYAELVFEGMKAYRVERSRPNFFRPDANCARLQRSASRMSMPAVPEALFFQGIGAVANACSPIMPTQSGRSLYLRPFLFGTESGYMLRNSHTFRFMVIANPVESYATGSMQVVIERAEVRAAVGGLGEAKASANYAASLRASNAAVERGRTVALWLDGSEHRYLQELSGMNIFAVLDGELHTPELDGAILPGITRDSLLVLARSLGSPSMKCSRASRAAAAARCLPAARPPSSPRLRSWWKTMVANTSCGKPMWSQNICASRCWPFRSGVRRIRSAGHGSSRRADPSGVAKAVRSAGGRVATIGP